jgi:SPP1 family predicted phage head-tail adaptor
VNISALRHEIEILKRITTKDAYGGPVTAWKSIGKEWADVRSAPGEEFRAGVFTLNKVPYRVMIRYRTGLDETMKLRNLTDGMFLDVEAIRDPDGRRQVLELQCLYRADQQDIQPS